MSPKAETANEPFDGFPEQALIFYEGLEADNSKPYWTDHKATFDTCVKAPMDALARELEPRYGTAKVFRPYRDVRFSRDKTPYKTQAAMAVEDSTALYLALGADGLFLAGGMYQSATDQVERFRAAVAEDKTGKALERVLAKLTDTGWEVGGEQLKTRPRGYPPDAPRMELLRHKSLTASRQETPGPWLHTRDCLEIVRARWDELKSLNAWLADHVGASRLPAPERR